MLSDNESEFINKTIGLPSWAQSAAAFFELKFDLQGMGQRRDIAWQNIKLFVLRATRSIVGHSHLDHMP